jgi:hypothetical protein
VSDQALVLEKIETEKVEQRVKIAGVDFDDKKLKLDTAQTVSDIANKTKETRVKEEQVKKMSTSKPGYNEKGMKSNNKE